MSLRNWILKFKNVMYISDVRNSYSGYIFFSLLFSKKELILFKVTYWNIWIISIIKVISMTVHLMQNLSAYTDNASASVKLPLRIEQYRDCVSDVGMGINFSSNNSWWKTNIKKAFLFLFIHWEGSSWNSNLPFMRN